MKLVSKLSVAAGVIALAMVPIAYAVDVAQLYVTPDDALAWADVSVDGGAAQYVDGAPISFGAASLELTTNDYFTARAGYMRADFMKLEQLTKAGYWAKQISTLNLKETAQYEMDLDLDGDWSTDTTIIYKPSKQIGGAFVQSNTWQYWDATNGQFYSTSNYGSGETALKNDGSVYPLSTIKSWYPLAQIQVLGVMIGDNLPNSKILVDGITVGDSTYDFEKVIPTNEEVVSVPKTIQECKKYGWETLFTTEGENFKNQGQCVSYIVSSKAKVK